MSDAGILPIDATKRIFYQSLRAIEDGRRWIDWLFEAKKRYNSSVLNYMVASNHIRLLVHDDNGQNVIPK